MITIAWPNDWVNHANKFITYNTYRAWYIVIDGILCLPLLWLIVYGIIILAYRRYKQLGGIFSVTSNVLRAIKSILVNYRELLAVMFMNRVRRFFFMRVFHGNEMHYELVD